MVLIIMALTAVVNVLILLFGEEQETQLSTNNFQFSIPLRESCAGAVHFGKVNCQCQ